MNDQSPLDGLRSSTKSLVHDALELADLQLQLFAADGREMARKAAPLLLLAAIGVTIAFTALPLLMVALAYALVEMAGFAVWLAMLSSAVAGMAVGGATVLIAIRRLRPHLTIWRRSAAELRENVDFLKGKISPSDFRPPNNTMSNRPQAHRQGRQGVQEHSVVDSDQ